MPAMAPSYRPSARRGQEMDPATKRLALFAGVIGTALLGLVAVWAFTGHHHGGVPVIEADSRPVKSKPANPGGMQVDGANDSILSGESDGKATVAPGPETPAPQALKAAEQAAAPQPPAVAATQPAAEQSAAPPQTAEARPLPPLRPHSPSRSAAASLAPSSSEGGAAVRLIPGAKSPGPLASSNPKPPGRQPVRLMAALAHPALIAQATTTPSGDQPIQSEPLAPAPGSTAAPPAATSPAPAAAPPAAQQPAAPPAAAQTAPPPAHGKRALVQFAAVDSGEAALREWQRLSRAYPELFGGHTPNITKTEHGGHTYWRVRTGGFTDKAQAAAFCQKLKAKGGTCTVAF